MAVARGLDVKRLEAQWREIAQVRRKLARRIKILRGMEVDILRDGSLDLPDEMLARLDIVVVSIHSQMRMSKRAMTDRVLRGIAHPFVDILAPPTGRLINRRTPVDIDLEAVFAAAADNGVAVELNAQPDRLDLGDVQVRRAKELGVPLVIDTDAHSTATLDFMRYGVDQARRGWLEAKDVLNTSSFRDLSDWSRRKRERVAKGIRNQNRNRDYIRRVAAVVE